MKAGKPGRSGLDPALKPLLLASGGRAGARTGRSTVLQKARGQQSKPNAYATCKSRSTFPKKVHAKQPKHVRRYRCPDCAAKH
jgi:hypothetical protein